jgi:hypothetical protein
MRRLGLASLAAAAAGALLAPPAMAGDRVVSATGVGKVQGRDVVVEVLVVVPEGANEAAAKRKALADQGARPRGGDGPQSAGYAFTGLYWEVLPVVQRDNPSGQPLGSYSNLRATQSAWSSVSGSSFRMSDGGTTSTCPSLVKGCRGGQRFDGGNDVGWLRLSGGTLGVTWYSTSIDEADMALNTRFGWSNTCAAVSGRYDVQTVFLHENGHVAGLDHSGDRSAVMYPSYQGPRCSLAADDRAGIAALY